MISNIEKKRAVQEHLKQMGFNKIELRAMIEATIAGQVSNILETDDKIERITRGILANETGLKRKICSEVSDALKRKLNI